MNKKNVYIVTWWDATGDAAEPWLGEETFASIDEALEYIKQGLKPTVTASIAIYFERWQLERR